ncbi:hypothetical protein AURDEDRAFT_113684 [Auricularia subglabra TFB-10046 SS5]|nr:hypothetical protein AURDEDRAFT_113684 [Auricularia subglabra TFB-10046 SS5]
MTEIPALELVAVRLGIEVAVVHIVPQTLAQRFVFAGRKQHREVAHALVPDIVSARLQERQRGSIVVQIGREMKKADWAEALVRAPLVCEVHLNLVTQSQFDA